MFSDPFSAVMALILLAFVGTLAVFFRIWRELDGVRRSLNDIRESLQYYSVDAAQQNRELASLVRELRGLAGAQEQQESDNLGDLLDRGLPNLVDASSQKDQKGLKGSLLPDLSAPAAVAAFGGHAEEDDFLRRFEAGAGKGHSS